MKLVNFPNLKDLSGIVKLPSLNTLELNNLSAVESIGGGPFPLLKELNIKKMPHLSECSMIIFTNLSDRDGGVSNYQALRSFPCLRVLEIIRCPKLKVKPSFPSSLESLVLANSSMQLLDTPNTSALLEAATTCSSSSYKGGSAPSSLPLLKILNLCAMMASSSRWNLLEELVGLQSLEISSCDDLAELPLSMRKLTSLQQLKIWNCVSLQTLPGWIGELSSLGRMDIRGCTRLSSLPLSMVQLNSLQHLIIGNCDALRLPEWMGDLGSLQSLDIWGLPGLTCLPPSLQHLSSLQTLKLSCFDALLVLPEWLGELSALQQLKIETCPSLASLPISMRRLTSLQELEIIRCPKLRRRYRKGEGEDWQLISHIPHVDIWNITDED
jgi:Leucine-rich repeat (LRR) protein